MAIVYVANDGDDLNDGSTWALAKATLSGGQAIAGTGGTVYVQAGHYSEHVTLNDTIYWIAVGEVVIDNSVGGLTNAFQGAGWATFHFVGNFILDGFINGCLDGAGWFDLNGCTARNNTNAGFNMPNGSFASHATNCKCYSNGVGIYSTTGAVIENNSCYLNGSFGISVVGACIVRNNICFSNVNGQVVYDSLASTNLLNTDYNHYDLGTAVNNIGYVGGVGYATLALFQAALTNGAESHSTTGTTEVNDAANFLLYDEPTSDQLLGTGLCGANRGLGGTAYGMSVNENAAKITGGVFSDTEWDAVNSRLQLLGAATSGYWRSDVIDLGTSRAFFGLSNVYAARTWPTDVLNYNNASAAPKTYTYRYRVSATTFAKTDVLPAWVEATIGNELAGVTGRYVQVELTLRNDGA
jgi:hypothetical protein